MQSLSVVAVFVSAMFPAGLSHLNTGFQEPPACSRFECEYKILERLIKLELERDALMTEVGMLRGKLDVQSSVISKLEEEVKRHNSVLGASPKPTVAVKARLSRDVTLKENERLVYDVIVSNDGNAYDPQSGIFRAPVNATYIISVTACAKNSDQFSLNIVKDGTAIIGQLRAGDDSYKDCNAEVTAAYLTVGSSISVIRSAHYNDKHVSGLQETVYWNSFTIALVN